MTATSLPQLTAGDVCKGVGLGGAAMVYLMVSTSSQRLIRSGIFMLTCACARPPCQELQHYQPRPDDADLRQILGEGGPAPRCTPKDPGCGPVALRDRNACFRPSEKRERLPVKEADEPPDPRAAASFACSHDGECNLTGCGNVCSSYRTGPMTTNCIGYEWLDRAQFCGCVEGSCAFFKQ